MESTPKTPIRLSHKVNGLINVQQKIAADGLCKHLKEFITLPSGESSNNSTHPIVLSGPAGTGKTTLINAFTMHSLSKLIPQSSTPIEFIFAAPTNQALKVLRNATSEVGETNKNIHYTTVSKLINIKFETDPKTGEEKPTNGGVCRLVSEILKRDPGTRFIIIIDEISMVKPEDLCMIMDLYDCMVICMGDECQLSPVYSDSELESASTHVKYKSVFDMPHMKHYTLTKVIRQKNSQLRNKVNQFRHFVKEPRSHIDIEYTSGIKDRFGKTTVHNTFVDTIIGSFKHSQSQPLSERTTNRIVTASNKKSQEYNQTIQKILHPELESTGAPFGKGEAVISMGYLIRQCIDRSLLKVHRSTTKSDPGNISINFHSQASMSSPILYSESDWFVPQTSAYRSESAYYKAILAPTSTLGYVTTTPHIAYVHVPEIPQFKKPIKAWMFRVHFEEEDENEDGGEGYLMCYIHEKYLLKFKKMLEDVKQDTMHKVGSMFGLESEYGGKEGLKQAMVKEWTHYKILESLSMNAPYMKLSLAYSTTVYKAQGSQYDRVFVDMQNIILCKYDEDTTTRCLYTAVSRCINQCFVYYPYSWERLLQSHELMSEKKMIGTQRTIVMNKNVLI